MSTNWNFFTIFNVLLDSKIIIDFSFFERKATVKKLFYDEIDEIKEKIIIAINNILPLYIFYFSRLFFIIIIWTKSNIRYKIN